MLHLNSGLLLRHPGESAYAAARRFACANRALSYAALVREARERLPAVTGPGRTARLSSVCRLAAHVEAAHCQRYGIPLPGYALDPPNPFAANPWGLRIARNCPQCARLLFHSPLYELPWLRECPLHRCALVDICPTCQKPWPALHEIWARRCPTCGRPANRDTWMLAVRHPADCTTEPLAPLQRAVDYRHAWTDCYLWAGDDRRVDPYDTYTRSPLSPRAPSFPTIISRFDVDFRAFCAAQQIPVGACFWLTIPCPPTSDNGMRYDPTAPPPPWVRHCRHQVAAKIAAAIARCAGPAHHLTPPTPLGTPPPRCAFCAAYLLWHCLIAQPPLRRSEAFAWTLTQSRWYGALPPPPQPLPLLTQHAQQVIDSAASSPRLRVSETHYALPQAAQRWLYAVDLWTTFVAIFRHVEHHYGSSPGTPPQEQPPSPLPPRLDESLVASIAFWKPAATDCLHIYIPKALLRPRLETARAAQWLVVCTTHENQRGAVSATTVSRDGGAAEIERQRFADTGHSRTPSL